MDLTQETIHNGIIAEVTINNVIRYIYLHSSLPIYLEIKNSQHYFQPNSDLKVTYYRVINPQKQSDQSLPCACIDTSIVNTTILDYIQGYCNLKNISTYSSYNDLLAIQLCFAKAGFKGLK